MKIYEKYLTENIKNIMPKLSSLKIDNMGSYFKAEIKTSDGTIMNLKEKNIEKLMNIIYSRVKEY